MQKVLILQGIPGSGKSTWALKEVARSRGKIKRINKDDLRQMVDGGEWSKQNEPVILQARNKLLIEFLLKGFDVVIDDTHLNPIHEIEIRSLVDQHFGSAVIVETKFFDVPVEECIRRDSLRTSGKVGADVINRMAKQLVSGKPAKPTFKVNTGPIVPYIAPGVLPSAIICDIDGTLAHMSKEGRLRFGKQAPYMWHHVGEDSVDVAVAGIVQSYYRFGHSNVNDDNPEPRIILFSGRDSVCRPETEKWLKDNNIPYDELHMRPEKNSEKDYKIKLELFEQHVRGKYNVLFILDDRDQVVRMWRGLGLKVLQVAPGDF